VDGIVAEPACNICNICYSCNITQHHTHM
jgi:hypothetical protein